MPTFSTGEYARHISTGTIIQIHTLTNETVNGYPLAVYIPWEPIKGEQCLFSNPATQYGKECTFAIFSHQGLNKQYYTTAKIGYSFCTPF